MELTEALSDLDRRGLALIVRKSGETVYESQDAMLRPLVDCIRTRKEDMKGATVIDKVVGEAAAKLLLYAEVASVYTRVASEGAAAALRSSNVHLETERTVENILRRDKKDICPMEKMSREFLSPEKFYRELCETMCFVQNDRLSISRRP